MKRRKPKTVARRDTERVEKIMDEVARVLEESRMILERITTKWGHPNV